MIGTVFQWLTHILFAIFWVVSPGGQPTIVAGNSMIFKLMVRTTCPTLVQKYEFLKKVAMIWLFLQVSHEIQDIFFFSASEIA